MQCQPSIQRVGGERFKDERHMDDIKYPERIERMLDVMVCLPKNAWGLVLLDVEKKVGTVALQRIISLVYEIEKASVHGKGNIGRKRKRQSAINAPKIIASVPPPTQSGGDRSAM